MRKLTAIIALCLSATDARAQQDLSQATVTVIPVTAGIYMLQGAGGNIGLSVGNDDAFMIDDQYQPMTPKVLAAIRTVTQKPVRFLLNTHWHPDHTGGNENMNGAGAIIVAHDNVRRRMGTQQFIAALDSRVPASPRAALPVVTFSESVSFHVNGDSVRAFHVRNAHTDGDAIVMFRRGNVLHMGDTFFTGAYPFIDLSTGGSIDGTIAAINAALQMSNASTKVIPGHGPLGTRADLVRYRDVITDVRGRVAGLVARRRTLAQVLAAKPSAQYDAAWGKGFVNGDSFVTTVYNSLSQRGRNRR